MAMCNVQADSPRTTSRDSVLSSVSGENSRMFSHMAVVSHPWTSLHRKKPESMELQGSRIGAHPSHIFLAVKEDTISHYNTFSHYLYHIEQDILLLVGTMPLLLLYYFVSQFKEMPVTAMSFTVFSFRQGNLTIIQLCKIPIFCY